jgi:4-hydroxythreonine-4-phosphate dehydrogenase
MDGQSPKPLVGVVLGDPAGIGPELAAGLAADSVVANAVRLLVIGDRRIFDRGTEIAGTHTVVTPIREDELPHLPPRQHRFLDVRSIDPSAVVTGQAGEPGGASALANFRKALDLGAAHLVDAVCYTPFNKSAMRKSYPDYEDEVSFSAEHLGLPVTDIAEFNIQPRLWSARVTSHVPLSRVASLLTVESILNRIVLTDRAMRTAGHDSRRIAVAGLNPHAGDEGNFGREEIDVIGPAVEAARARGFDCSGPYSPDTVYVRARAAEFDAVLTMYHDQGQIAMKLMGFFEGVVYFAGLPFPLTTPAHGTAYEISGQGKANVGANRAAVLLAGRMVGRTVGEAIAVG